MYLTKALYCIMALMLFASCEKQTKMTNPQQNEPPSYDAKKPFQEVYRYYFLLTDDFADVNKRDVSKNAQSLKMAVQHVSLKDLGPKIQESWPQASKEIIEEINLMLDTSNREKLLEHYLSLSLKISSILTLRDFASGNTQRETKSIIRFLDSGFGKGNDAYLGKFNYLVGLFSYYQGNLYISNKYYSNALNTVFVKNDPVLSKACYNNKGINFEILNMFPEAISCYNESLKIGEKRNDSTGIARTWINIGYLNFKAKNIHVAEDYTLKALKYFTLKEDESNQGMCYQNLAIFNYQDENFQKSLSYSKKALELHRNAKDMVGIIQAIEIMGDAYRGMKNIPASNAILNEGLQLSLSHQIYDAAGEIYLSLIKNMIDSENYGNVESYFKKVEEVYEKTEYDARNNYFLVKAEYYAHIGDFAAYLKNENEYNSYKDQLEKKQAVETYWQLQSVYENERNAAKISEQKNKIAAIKAREQSLMIIAAIFFIALIIILYYYLRTQKYIKSLFIVNVKNMLPNTAAYEIIDANVEQESSDSLTNLYNQILEVMQSQKLYLMPNLSVSDISSALATNEKYISVAIKNHGNKNFNAFVNNYRINYAKKLLLEQADTLSLKVVSADSGFNNHTTFYRQFKEITGLAPVQFMEMCKENLKKMHSDKSTDDVHFVSSI